MAKYRIIQKTIKNGTGVIKIRFEIERIIRFSIISIWWPAAIKTHYFTYEGKACIINRYYSFNDLERAKEIATMLNSRVNMRYKGQRIKQVFSDDYRFKPVFINISNKLWWYKGYCFEFSESLDILKSAIDLREEKTFKNVVYVG